MPVRNVPGLDVGLFVGAVALLAANSNSNVGSGSVNMNDAMSSIQVFQQAIVR